MLLPQYKTHCPLYKTLIAEQKPSTGEKGCNHQPMLNRPIQQDY